MRDASIVALFSRSVKNWWARLRCACETCVCSDQVSARYKALSVAGSFDGAGSSW